MFEDAVLRRLDEPVEFLPPTLSFILSVEQPPRMLVDVDGDASLVRLFDWLAASPTVLADLEAMVRDLREAVAALDDDTS